MHPLLIIELYRKNHYDSTDIEVKPRRISKSVVSLSIWRSPPLEPKILATARPKGVITALAELVMQDIHR